MKCLSEFFRFSHDLTSHSFEGSAGREDNMPNLDWTVSVKNPNRTPTLDIQ